MELENDGERYGRWVALDPPVDTLLAYALSFLLADWESAMRGAAPYQSGLNGRASRVSGVKSHGRTFEEAAPEDGPKTKKTATIHTSKPTMPNTW